MEIADYITKHGITLTAERTVRAEFEAVAGPDDARSAHPSRTYWRVSLGREGATWMGRPWTLDTLYSLGSGAWDGVRVGAHRQSVRGPFGGTCAYHDCAQQWPCAEVIARGQPHPPTAADVLDSLKTDAGTYENTRGFEDWCGEFGYDTDSRKAERIYRSIADDAHRLRVLLGDEAYRELLEDVEEL